MLNKNMKINVHYVTHPITDFAAENLKKYLEQILECEVSSNVDKCDYEIELRVNPMNQDIKHDGFSITNTQFNQLIRR